MNYAEINSVRPEPGDLKIFLLLRAIHYAAEFHQAQEIRFSFAEPSPEIAAVWKQSLDQKKREVRLIYQADIHGVEKFSAPECRFRINGGKVVQLGIPEIPDLTDFHLHTRLAYCSENMDVKKAVALEHLSGVKHVNFSEHSGQLYCSAGTYWNNRFLWNGRQAAEDRTAEYHALIQAEAMPACSFGVELDVDSDSIVSDVPGLNGFRIGAIHFLGNGLSFEEKKRDFMRRLDALLASKIDILAHPFRVFLKGGMPIPEDLFEPVAKKIVRAGVAAEINFHTNRPQPEFIRLVLKKGGMISFGTDSHNLYEAGYLTPHYEFCKMLDIAGKLDSMLLHAEGRNPRQVPGDVGGTHYPATCASITERARTAFWANISNLKYWPGEF